MSKKQKMSKEELGQISAGAILSEGHTCENCGKEFSVILPNNPLDPLGMGDMPTSVEEIEALHRRQALRMKYCPECLHKLEAEKNL